MRPTLVAILAVVILGGVKWFLDAHKQEGSNPPGLKLIQAAGDYSVELTLTFDAGPDEFSLDDLGDAPSLLVRLNGDELLKRTDNVPALDSPIVLEAVKGVVVGGNEFYVQASPSSVDELKPRSIRIRVLRDGSVVADKTMWPELGDVVQGIVTLEVTQ